MKARTLRVISFIKSVPGIITSSVAAIGILWAIFIGAVAMATAPLAARVSNLENDHNSYSKIIEENRQGITNLRNELLSETYKLRISQLIEKDMGNGSRKDFILYYYNELLEICGNCESTKFDVELYLASLENKEE